MNQSAGQAVVSPPPPQRRRRPTRIGVCTSAVRDKTIRVTVSYSVKHAKYGKYLRRKTVLHAHDERNEVGPGDLVEVAACRPLSRTKHWRLVQILQKAPGAATGSEA